jgi:hypothetical protein
MGGRPKDKPRTGAISVRSSPTAISPSPPISPPPFRYAPAFSHSPFPHSLFTVSFYLFIVHSLASSPAAILSSLKNSNLLSKISSLSRSSPDLNSALLPIGMSFSHSLGLCCSVLCAICCFIVSQLSHNVVSLSVRFFFKKNM